MEISNDDTSQARQHDCILHVIRTYTPWLKLFQLCNFKLNQLKKIKEL